MRESLAGCQTIDVFRSAFELAAIKLNNPLASPNLHSHSSSPCSGVRKLSSRKLHAHSFISQLFMSPLKPKPSILELHLTKLFPNSPESADATNNDRGTDMLAGDKKPANTSSLPINCRRVHQVVEVTSLPVFLILCFSSSFAGNIRIPCDLHYFGVLCPHARSISSATP